MCHAIRRLVPAWLQGGTKPWNLGSQDPHHTLARISVGGKDVGAVLVQEQIAMPW